MRCARVLLSYIHPCASRHLQAMLETSLKRSRVHPPLGSRRRTNYGLFSCQVTRSSADIIINVRPKISCTPPAGPSTAILPLVPRYSRDGYCTEGTLASKLTEGPSLLLPLLRRLDLIQSCRVQIRTGSHNRFRHSRPITKTSMIQSMLNATARGTKAAYGCSTIGDCNTHGQLIASGRIYLPACNARRAFSLLVTDALFQE